VTAADPMRFGRRGCAAHPAERGDRVLGTVRDTGKVGDLFEQYPGTFTAEVLEMTDAAAAREVVDRAFAKLGRIDVVISNAGYGLFGAAEELSDAQVDDIIATNLTGPITLIRAVLPHLRAQGGGRIIQISSYGGQVAFAGNSLYHATKWGVEGFSSSARRPCKARSTPCAHASPTSRPRPSSPPPPTFHRASKESGMRARKPGTAPLVGVLELTPGDGDSRHGGRPPGVKGDVGDGLGDLLDRQAVGHSPPQMGRQLVVAIQGHQRGDGDQAAVPF
jgi:hypothetical protein